MKTTYQLSVPKPCATNWSAMTPVEQGRFCQSCQKKVFDFTKSSDREIALTVTKNGSICGRFNNTQLNRALVVPREKSSIWMATTSAIISFLGLGGEEIHAQETPKMEQTEGSFTKGKIALEVKNNKMFKISGIVSDESGPLPGASIIIKNTKKGVLTDIDGNYEIEVQKNDVLVFSFVGLKEKSVKVTPNTKNLNVTLESHPIMGVVIIQEKE